MRSRRAGISGVDQCESAALKMPANSSARQIKLTLDHTEPASSRMPSPLHQTLVQCDHVREMRFDLLTALACSAVAGYAQQNPVPADARQPSIRSNTQEVLLDVVVRDKKGHLVKDLTSTDFEVTDDAQPQQIRSFRLVTAAGVNPAAGFPSRAGGNSGAALDPLRQVRIITLAFDRLGLDARNISRTAVSDLLKSESGSNLFLGVFSIDQRLSVLQQYTTDKDLIRKAVTKVTSSASSLYKSESDQIEQELKTLATQQAAGAAVALPASAPPDGGSLAATALAQLTLNMLQFSQTMDRTLQGRSTLFALKSLITDQYRLPGRKTLLFFCEGLNIPPEYTDEFQALISSANRANVSVYGVDARGLVTFSQNGAAGSLLQQAVNGSRSQQVNRAGPVTPDQVTSADRGEQAIRENSQNSLADISEKTGGFLIANSNDLRTGLHRVLEDLDTHYEISYSPNIQNFDGHFRKIAVHVNRRDMRLQTRSGYYALPFLPGNSVLPYELPMLNALAASALPRDLPFRASGMHFKEPTGEPEGMIVIDVPLDGIQFTKDEANHVYQTHFSVLAVLKNSDGSIVQKFSQDVPRQGPLDKLDAFKIGHFIYAQQAPLLPGRYILETAVMDRQTGKVSARKSSMLIPVDSKTVSLSSLVRVRSISPLDSSENATSRDPFQFATGKVSPGLDDSAKGGPGTALSYFFIVYPEDSKVAPALSIEFLLEGSVIGRGSPNLPTPDSRGFIPYIATTPLESFKSGQYEMRVTVTQNGKSATERTVFTIL